jgi:hypothetical protein
VFLHLHEVRETFCVARIVRQINPRSAPWQQSLQLLMGCKQLMLLEAGSKRSFRVHGARKSPAQSALEFDCIRTQAELHTEVDHALHGMCLEEVFEISYPCMRRVMMCGTN